MATFKVLAKDKVDIAKKPRVYFTCHSQDFEKTFKTLCAKILRAQDVAIYYTEDMNEAISESEKETDLGRANLFVVPVTFNLLTTKNRAMDEDIPFAFDAHIPVLPIMMEPDIDEFYAAPEKFGNLQYLNPNSADKTEMPFEDKLNKFLGDVLLGDELAARIRAAFSAYVFLSYRKKDREYANRLMRLIHSKPEYRDIAIWFDEFLNPGENFNENIEKMLEDSKLFTLLVTPSVLEKVVDKDGTKRDNYVVSTELPLALKNKAEKGTEILAVEMEKTDKAELSKINIEDYVNVDDDEFQSRLKNAISGIVSNKGNTPEHSFLMGLAYLSGLDVEVNRELGIELITAAAEEGYIEAMDKLFTMYYNGIGTKIDYEKAHKWIKRMVEACVCEYGEEDSRTLDAMYDLMSSCVGLGYDEEAFEYSKKLHELTVKNVGEASAEAINSLLSLSGNYLNVRKIEEALSLGKKAYDLALKVLPENDPEMIWVLGNLQRIYAAKRDKEATLSLAETVYNMSADLIGETHKDTITRFINLAFCYGEFGEADTALELSLKAYEKCCTELEKDDPETLRALSNLATDYIKVGEMEKALETGKKAYELCAEIMGEEHPKTLLALHNLGCTYARNKKFGRAVALCEKAYNLRLEKFGAEHRATVASEETLANLYIKTEEFEKAVLLQEKIYKRSLKNYGEESEETATALNTYAAYHSITGDKEKSIELIEKAYALSRKLFGETDEKTLFALKYVGVVHKVFKVYDKAQKASQKAYRLYREIKGETDRKTIEAQRLYALVLLDKGNTKKAVELLENAYALSRQTFGENDTATAEAKRDLMLALSKK